jgi:hydroxyacylglutathione hydrolase
VSDLQFHQFNCLDDNFGVLVHSPKTGETAAIDAPETAAVERALAEKGWRLSHILVTHHHADHTQGIAPLKNRTGCRVIGPANQAITVIDDRIGDGDSFRFADEIVQVIATPGHTLDMVNYYFPDAGVLFTADTLFAMGCGRVFEGTPQQMWQSLEKLMALPANTVIYCGHEYTLANGRFALTVDATNAALQARVASVVALREKGEATLPTTMGEELATNPFLRASDPQIRENLAMEDASDAEVFAEIRARKDRG